MLCKHCGKKIPLLKRLTDAEFCSDSHRQAFMRAEEDAAISRLMQHGSRLASPEEDSAKHAPKKAKGSSKKQVRKDEIPAPLAGLVPEPTHRPKAKRKALSRPSVQDWELVRELPQSPLSLLARRFDVAGGIPLEPQPAKGLHGAHPAAVEALPAERLDTVELDRLAAAECAPLASETGPSPVALSAGQRTPDPGWQWPVVERELRQAGPGLGAAEFEGPGLAAATGARAVAMARPPAEVQADPREARGERRAPKMDGGVQPHVHLNDDGGGSGARGAVKMDVGEPEPCGLMALLVGVVGTERRTAGRRLEWAMADESHALAPRTAMAPAASMRQAEGMAGIIVAAGAAVAAAHGGEEKALKPKRRLIGPRVGRRGDWFAAVAEAPLVDAGVIPAAEGVRVRRDGGVSPLAPAEAESSIPAPRREGFRQQPELAGAALQALPDQRGLRGSGQAAAQGAPAWPVAESLIPVTGLGVEEYMKGTVEAAGAEPEVEGPPLFNRLLPVFASRGLKYGFEPRLGPESASGPSWTLTLSWQPAKRSSGLTVDHADGSGARTAGAVVKSNRPWHSIQLPSFHMASWRSAPADLKWIMMALPMILLIALYSFLPPQTKNSVETASGTASEPTVLSQRVKAIQTAIMERAAIKLADDFRSGLGAWQGQAGWAQTWTYTSANYAVPGQLALYGPSLRLRDYVFSFLGQIDRRSINWVVRARDERNYLAMRIVMTRSGPLPAASLVRYAVVDGKAGNQTVLPLPMTFRDGTMQEVEVTVAGDTITTRVMGQIVDSFTESTLDAGGVGFYSPKGDKSLLRWMLVTHQYDYIGRLCALLAPHSVMREDARRME